MSNFFYNLARRGAGVPSASIRATVPHPFEGTVSVPGPGDPEIPIDPPLERAPTGDGRVFKGSSQADRAIETPVSGPTVSSPVVHEESHIQTSPTRQEAPAPCMPALSSLETPSRPIEPTAKLWPTDNPNCLPQTGDMQHPLRRRLDTQVSAIKSATAPVRIEPSSAVGRIAKPMLESRNSADFSHIDEDSLHLPSPHPITMGLLRSVANRTTLAMVSAEVARLNDGKLDSPTEAGENVPPFTAAIKPAVVDASDALHPLNLAASQPSLSSTTAPIHVRIGRIEVRGKPPEPRPPATAPPVTPPRGFADYLGVRTYRNWPL